MTNSQNLNHVCDLADLDEAQRTIELQGHVELPREEAEVACVEEIHADPDEAQRWMDWQGHVELPASGNISES